MEQSGENTRMGAPGSEEREEARTGSGQAAGAGTPASTSNEEDEVRRRAYELYIARGGEPGREFDDWYAAEQEVRGRRAGGSPPTSGAGEASQREAGQREPAGGESGAMGEGAAGSSQRAATPRKRSAPSRRGRSRDEG